MDYRFFVYPLIVLLVLAVGAVLLLDWREAKFPTSSTRVPFKVDVEEPRILSSQQQRGKELYYEYCNVCHGKAAGGGVGGPPLVEYSASHHNDQHFVNAIRFGVKQHHFKYGDMPSVDGLKGEDAQLIVQYIRALQAYNDQRKDAR